MAYDKKNNDYRTEKVNSVFDLMRSLSMPSGGKNKRPISVSANRSGLVAGTGLEFLVGGKQFSTTNRTGILALLILTCLPQVKFIADSHFLMFGFNQLPQG
ncbi:hypothetical protein ACFS7Z_20140 [Pontibacter toksunensis]|uniref:Uncharacterized protein n=1 Tax=Pontibacter toksunensis TaxID=1332631 RepID=A0ABW6C0H6_9BACT